MMASEIIFDVSSLSGSLEKVKKDILNSVKIGSFNFLQKVRQQAIANLKTPDSKGRKLDFKRGLSRGFEIKREGIGGSLFNTSDHAAPVEFGSKKHFIPRKVIEDNNTGLTAWVRLKMRPTVKIARKRRSKKSAKEIKLQKFRSIAWAIARKKTKNRTLPRPFFEPAITRVGDEEGLLSSIVNEFNKQ